MARSGGSPDGVYRKVDSFDLLAGIMLADPAGSPIRDLLDHFRIPVGTILLRDNVSLPSIDKLINIWADTPTDRMPPLDREVDDLLGPVLRQGLPARRRPSGLLGLGGGAGGSLWSLRDLGGLLLTDPRNPARRLLIDRLGSYASAVLASYGEYLDSRQSYAEFLRERFPRVVEPIGVADFLSDQPVRRERAATQAGLADLVDIRHEVNAFAYLIASTRLAPPLAVGLFGAWGSGKSYFMRSLQNRLDEIAERVRTSTDAPPFHGSIVQIEFNAWQYVEGDLWSSLLEHLFRNLRLSEKDGEDLVRARGDHWAGKMRDARSEHEKAVKERDRLVTARQNATVLVEQRELLRTERLAALDEQLRRNPLRSWEPNKELRAQIGSALHQAGFDTVATKATELSAELDRAQRAVATASPVLEPLRRNGWRYRLAVLGVLAAVPTVPILLQWLLNASGVAALTGALVPLLAGAIAHLRLGTQLVAGMTQAIARAQADLAQAQADERSQLDAEVEAAETALAEVTRELAEATETARQRATELAAAETELAGVTPGRVLAEFIADRLGSDDYRKHLGVPALVRRDLDQLSRLVDGQDEAEPDATHRIDRIVLYIDDLDRCPTELVVKVLQAVHLLLAFRLFVVVVAVDSRWLESSLRDHYRQLAGADATPEDYLEKIFQVPFQIRPLGGEVGAAMLDGLLRPSLAVADGPAPAAADTGAVTVTEAERAELARVVDSFRTTETDRPELDAAALTITAEELQQISAVAGLVGSTPRAVKRFVNIYLLVRAMGQGQGLDLPPDGQLALLLAIATGLPRLATELFPRLHNTTAPLTSLLPKANNDKASTDTDEQERGRFNTELAVLTRWLAAEPGRTSVTITGTSPWLSLIERFRFTAR
jgi:hypothetical protein